jgi:hypothetical protein
VVAQLGTNNFDRDGLGDGRTRDHYSLPPMREVS